MECPFKVGEEVICIDATPTNTGPQLVKGKTYVILDIFELQDGRIGVAVFPYDIEQDEGWYWTRFRRPQINEEDTDLREALSMWGPSALVGRQFKIKVPQ